MEDNPSSLRLGDSCIKIGSGATPRGGSKVYLSSGTSLIRSQNVYNHGFSTNGLAFIGEEHATQLDNVSVEEDDVLLNITGDSVARCCQASKEILPARVNQHVAIIRPKSKELDAAFLRYYLISPYMQEYMLVLASAGGTRKALTKGMVENFDIPALSYDNQHAIAEVLGSLDDKIELNRRMNETLESLARAIFKSWFVDFDPVSAKAEGHQPASMDAETAAFFSGGFEESPLGKIPRGWETGSIEDVAQNIRRSIKPENIPSETPYIGLEHMPRKSIALSNWGFAENVTSNKFQFKGGEILFGKLRPYFHKVGVAILDGICSTDILVVAPKKAYNFGLLLGHLSSVEFINYVNAGASGTKMPRTNWKVMAQFEIAIPPKELSIKYSYLISPMIAKIQTNIEESHALASLRDALLPRLIRGDMRVKDHHMEVGK
jgi:type I restriction enzyme, S subunit